MAPRAGRSPGCSATAQGAALTRSRAWFGRKSFTVHETGATPSAWLSVSARRPHWDRQDERAAGFGFDSPARGVRGGRGGLGRIGMTDEPLRHEKYTHGHAPAVVRQHALRTAEEAAAFLLPELRPGMRLLDVGCGPGSITRGLAERLAPGLVVGVDLSRETLAAARQDAADRGLTNLLYEQGSVYQLPFPDASFDVAYAHQVFQHLREPEAAL